MARADIPIPVPIPEGYKPVYSDAQNLTDNTKIPQFPYSTAEYRYIVEKGTGIYEVKRRSQQIYTHLYSGTWLGGDYQQDILAAKTTFYCQSLLIYHSANSGQQYFSIEDAKGAKFNLGIYDTNAQDSKQFFFDFPLKFSGKIKSEAGNDQTLAGSVVRIVYFGYEEVD